MQQHSPTDPTGARPNDAVLFVALELSRASWLVAIQAPGRDKISRHKLAAGASAELLELVGRQRARAEHRTGGKLRVMSCYEAGRDGFWLHRLLVANGIENLVIDPASVAVNDRRRDAAAGDDGACPGRAAGVLGRASADARGGGRASPHPGA